MDYSVAIRDPWLEERISGRVSLFMDTNMWIKIVRAQRPIYSEIMCLLQELVAHGKLFCPLYKDVLQELFKQEYESARPIAEYMDVLCLNTCFATPGEIFDKEVLRIVEGFVDQQEYKLGINDLYVPVFGFISSYLGVVYQHDPEHRELDRGVRGMIEKKLAPHLAQASVTQLLGMFRKEMPRRYYLDPSKMMETRRLGFESTKGNIQKMRRIEQEAVAKSHILPTLKKYTHMLPPTTLLRFVEYMKSLPKDQQDTSLTYLLDLMPALRSYAEVMTVSGLDVSRTHSINDFHDLEMLVVPLTYADVFVSQDRWIRHLLNQVSNLPEQTSTRYISRPEDYRDYLISLKRECA